MSCDKEDCGRPIFARGMCQRHYYQARKAGFPPAPSPIERFMAKVKKKPNGCWVWTSATDDRGYGLFWAGPEKGSVRAYRWIYEEMGGVVRRGQHLDHFYCDNPICVNPAHVRPTSPRENILRGVGIAAANLAKTECKRGHPFDDENTRFDKNGGRTCRTCERARRKPKPRRVRAVRTHCGRGHPYDESNTYYLVSGRRGCRTCRRASALAYWRRKQAGS